MAWDVEPSAVEYHVYRGLLSNLFFSDFGSCVDSLDTVQSDTILDDTTVVPPLDGYFYLVTAEDGSGNEGSLGGGARAERSNFSPCP